MRYFTPTKISENITETPEGFLVCIGVPIARTGEMLYGETELPLEGDDKGRIVISRSEDEVFRPETMASFEGKPITITHPKDFVTPESWKHLAKGTMQNVRRGEGDLSDSLIADLLITDKDAINLVKNGLREVSCGYDADYTQVEEGRANQTNIVGNHLALVDKGRAGSTYAINDHQGKVTKMGLKEIKSKVTTIFARAQDEAMKAVDEATEAAVDDSAKQTRQDPSSGKPASATDAMKAYDEMKAMVGDMSTKIGDLASKLAAMKVVSGDDKVEEKKEESKDDAPSMEDRMSKLEAAVSKLLEGATGDAEKEDKEETDDEGCEDDDFEEGTMTGDTVSRIEILAPGLSSKTKDAKVVALKTAYATKEGKKAIEAFTGGKTPTYDAAQVETLFIGASELLKVTRTKELSGTKQGTRDSSAPSFDGGISAEKMNEINAKHYKRA